MAIDDDFELCNELYKQIVDHFDVDLQAKDLPESSRTVLLVWHATGIIGNGGFEYLFEGDFAGDPGYELTLRAFEAIGSDLAANAFRDALGLFPKSQIHTDIEERTEYYTSLPYDERMDLNSRFWSASLTGNDEIKTKLADFIRAHKNDFDW
jgi:hypothetical protein